MPVEEGTGMPEVKLKDKKVVPGQPSGGWSGSPNKVVPGRGGNTPDSARTPNNSPAATPPNPLSYLDTINANYLARLRATPGAMSANNQYLTTDPYSQRLAAGAGRPPQDPWSAYIPPGLQAANPGASPTSLYATNDMLPQQLPGYPTDGGYPWDYGGGGGGGGGGDGGGGGGGGGEGGWKEYDVATHPDWWKGLANMGSAETQVASLLNALIPTMSGNDQYSSGDYLARAYAEQFGNYDPTKLGQESFAGRGGGAFGELTPGIENWFLSDNRASEVLSALDNMEAATGTTGEKRGKGSAWLRSVAGVMRDFGGGGDTNSLTGTQREQQQAQWGALSKEAQGNQDLAPFAAIARMLMSPFFSEETFNPSAATPTGGMAFGQRNPTLF